MANRIATGLSFGYAVLFAGGREESDTYERRVGPRTEAARGGGGGEEWMGWQVKVVEMTVFFSSFTIPLSSSLLSSLSPSPSPSLSFFLFLPLCVPLMDAC